ncbi:chemotaxis protein [Shewanella olleyana]|uniref:chemotaxis protein n=1 Tax=Shewanella olleyana TaxID=135626 RepID=UPI00200C170D|nr:chemotaxis protein [Shewanella olleyana]MCL1065334.1 chemotaxis protein [Shewanella olleyana]
MKTWLCSAVKRLSFVTMMGLSLVVMTGCSLLEVKLESGVEPLPKEQVNMRMFSREFSYSFYTQVEASADLIANSTDDVSIISNTLMWKIYSEQNLQRAIFQASPVAAMIDTWVFTEQMNQYFLNGAGSEVFGEHQAIAIEASEILSSQFAKTVKGFVDSSSYKKHQDFVNQYVADNPIQDISFSRTSAFQDWLAYSEISEFEAITTFGSMPEVMSDMSDRMAMTTQQMPKILGWKAELYALHADVNAADVEQALKNISETTVKFQALMEQTPEMMTLLASDLRTELSPLIQQLSEVTDDKLHQLSKERASLALIITHEREALVQMIADEREAAVQDLDSLTQRTVELVFKQVTDMLKSMIVYFILFLIAVFFAPLGFGVWLGKRMAIKQQA